MTRERKIILGVLASLAVCVSCGLCAVVINPKTAEGIPPTPTGTTVVPAELTATAALETPTNTPPPSPTATSTPAPTVTLTETASPFPSPTLPPTETPSPSFEGQVAQVIRVIDGDTVEVELDGLSHKVRYIGMNTPEMDEVCGPEAKAVNASLVEGQTVRLVKDVSDADKYHRLLRYVYVGDIFVNAELVRLGYASAATYPPDVKYSDLFVQLEREAREARRGCWTAPLPTVAPPTPTSPPADASDVRIECIFYDGQVYRAESDEYVRITNFGASAQDLAGWRLMDISEGYPSLVFPSYVLGSGESIRVYTDEYHPESGGFSFGYGQAVWNNKEPDVAALHDAQSQEVSRKSYPPGCY